MLPVTDSDYFSHSHTQAVLFQALGALDHGYKRKKFPSSPFFSFIFTKQRRIEKQQNFCTHSSTPLLTHIKHPKPHTNIYLHQHLPTSASTHTSIYLHQHPHITTSTHINQHHIYWHLHPSADPPTSIHIQHLYTFRTPTQENHPSSAISSHSALTTMASSSRAAQTSQTPQEESFRRTPGDFPTDSTPPPDTDSTESSHMLILEGDEVIERKCRATRDGSKAPHPFVEFTAWDKCGNLPSRNSTRMEFPLTGEFNEKFSSWIDPNTGLGYTVYLDFRRAENSTEKHVARIWDGEVTEPKLEPTMQMELRPKR